MDDAPSSDELIIDWLAVVNDPLAKAFSNCCLSRLRGLTLLCPSEPGFGARMLALSDTNEDEASSILQSLLFRGLFPTADSFSVGDVGNLLNIKHSVQKSGSSVALDNGNIQLTPYPGSPPITDFCIWKISTNAMPLRVGPKFIEEHVDPVIVNHNTTRLDQLLEVSRHDLHYSAVVRGPPRTRREQIANLCAADFSRGCVARNFANHANYLSCITSLLDYIQSEHPDLFRALHPLMSLDPVITFHLLVEPYKTADFVRHPLMISDEVFNKWGGIILPNATAAAYKKMLLAVPAPAYAPAPVPVDAAAAAAATAVVAIPAIYSNRPLVATAIDEIRTGQKDKAHNMKVLPKLIMGTYRNLYEKNCIGGVVQVLPKETIDIVGGAFRGFRLDSIRMYMHFKLREIRCSTFSSSDFESMISQLRDNFSGNCDSESPLYMHGLLPGTMKSVHPRMDLLSLAKFHCSIFYTYMITSDESQLLGPSTGSRDPTDLNHVYNDQATELAELNATKPSSTAVTNIAEVTKMRVQRLGGKLAAAAQ